MKKALIATAIILVVVIAIIFALPLLIDVNRFRPLLEERLSQGIGRQVKIGHIALAFYKGELRADDVSVAEDPAFGSEPFVKARALEVGVDLMPLIRSRALNVRALRFDEPQVVLLRNAAGVWNFSSLGQHRAAAAPPRNEGASGAPLPQFTVAKFEVARGRVALGGVSGKGAEDLQVYDNVNVTANNVALDASFPFSLDATTPGGGSLKISGDAGPVNAADAAQTPFRANVEIENFDLAKTGVVDASAGLAGILNYGGEVRSDGKVATTDGTAKIEKLRLVKTGSAATQPVALRYATEYNLEAKKGRLTKGELVTGQSNVSLTGAYASEGPATVLDMHLSAPGVAVKDLQALLPALGITLPAGSNLQGGTAVADLSIQGPLDKFVTRGDVKLADAKLTGFGLASKLSALSVFTGLKPIPDSTTIELFSSNLQISPQGIQSRDVKLVVPEIGTITGAGTIAANGALDFKLTASLSNTGVGGAVAGLASRVGLGNATSKAIPFKVGGTTSNPSFAPDTGAIVKGVIKGQQQEGGALTREGIGNMLNGIFGGKKQQQ